MSGRDSLTVLAVLAMIVPTLTLIAAVAFALGVSGTAKVPKEQDASMRVKAQAATQKRMRDPWEKPVYAKTSSAPRAPRCDASVNNQETPCYYW